ILLEKKTFTLIVTNDDMCELGMFLIKAKQPRLCLLNAVCVAELEDRQKCTCQPSFFGNNFQAVSSMKQYFDLFWNEEIPKPTGRKVQFLSCKMLSDKCGIVEREAHSGDLVVCVRLEDLEGLPRPHQRGNPDALHTKTLRSRGRRADSSTADRAGICPYAILVDSQSLAPQKCLDADLAEMACRIIYFSPPKSLQYFSIEPLVLDLNETIQKERDLAMVKRLWKGHGDDHATKLAPSLDWDQCLREINSIAPPYQSPHIPSVVAAPGRLVASVFYSLFQTLLWLLNVRLPIVKTSLTRVSCVAQQLDLRLRQLCFWPEQYARWWESPLKKSPLAQAQYIGFFNTFWLIANDIIIGTALRTILLENKDFFAALLDTGLKTYTIDTILSGLSWLMDWPAGLKLNSELASFLGELFSWMTIAWRDLLERAAPHFSVVLAVAGMAGVLGGTFSLSILADLLAFLTLHLQLFYIISARIYNWTIVIIASTFNLFRGRKWNPLRKRSDSAEYDLDQLLLGAVIFTLSAVAVILLLQSLLEIILAILNHFPLFALMLRVKDPRRLSDGIYLAVRDPKHKPGAVPEGSVQCLYLQNQPIGWKTIFYQYGYLFSRISDYYFNATTLKAFFNGTRVHALPKLSVIHVPSSSQREPIVLQWIPCPPTTPGLLEMAARASPLSESHGPTCHIDRICSAGHPAEDSRVLLGGDAPGAARVVANDIYASSALADLSSELKTWTAGTSCCSQGVAASHENPLFVTWHIQGSSRRHLRGCIGNFTPLELKKGLRDYAKISAFQDSRFPPIAAEELPKLSCSVSLLHSFEEVPVWNDWQIGVHGLRISYRDAHHKTYTATYLPDVMLEQGWTQIQTMESLLRKAGFRDPVNSRVLDAMHIVRYQSSKAHASYQDYLDWKAGSL
ncbi:phosphatidylinositol N-acetylglucosaminyltransferase subunit gpi1, partial [Kappamyces sp. JEL0680]